MDGGARYGHLISNNKSNIFLKLNMLNGPPSIITYQVMAGRIMFTNVQVSLSPQVVLSKFHSVFLSQKGQAFTCGHGQGGRLGHGDEQTYLVQTGLNIKGWC